MEGDLSLKKVSHKWTKKLEYYSENCLITKIRHIIMENRQEED